MENEYKTRMESADSVRNVLNDYLQADEMGSRKRAMVDGLIDGNAPRSRDKLKRAGMGDVTNINFGEAKGHVNNQSGALYDIVAEAPSFATCKLEGQQDISDIIGEEFQRINRRDRGLDFCIQLSQGQIARHGAGPITWVSPTDWKARSIRYNQLLVSKDAASDTSFWEDCVLLVDYKPHEIERFIRNPEAAAAMGWQLDSARKAIINACPKSDSQNQQEWEWTQDKLRRNALSYSGRGKMIETAHYYWKEDNDRISMAIILKNESKESNDFLFKAIGKYESWDDIIHPFWGERGDGTHHGVKGMGVAMYPLLEVLNRMQCAETDAAFDALCLMFQGRTPEDAMKTASIRIGARIVLPPEVNYISRNEVSRIDASMMVERSIRSVLQSNLSQYRTSLDQVKGGNPITAEEFRGRMTEQLNLRRTDLARYQQQLDYFWQSRFDRLVKATDQDAKDFRSRVSERIGAEIPQKIWNDVEVSATRIAGQGSPFVRFQTLQQILGMIGSSLPERTKITMMNDMMAAGLGREMASRYPAEPEQEQPGRDEWEANEENNGFVQGAMGLITPMQNNAIHAGEHIKFMSQAVASVEQGGNPIQILATLQAGMPHAQQHVMMMMGDPLRKPIAGAYMQQLTKLTQAAQQIQQMIQQQQQQPPTPPEEVVKTIDYKAAPPDIQRQIEALAGFQPSQMGGSSPTDKLMLNAQKSSIQAQLKASQINQAQSQPMQDLQIQALAANQDMQIKDAQAAQKLRHKEDEHRKKMEEESSENEQE